MSNEQIIDNRKKISYGVGYNIGNKYPTQHKFYDIWHEMLRRCYCTSNLERKPTYIDCIVCTEWLNYQVFAEWCHENYIDGFVLDKDILQKCNKIYSPETCCFVPLQINGLFCLSNKIRGKYPVGVKAKRHKFQATIKKFGKSVSLGCYFTPEEAFNVYKSNKEFYILQVANLWKSQLPEKVYQALINYKIEIND